jgi:hypothetical protein
MNKRLNELLTEKISKNVPKNMKLIDYLIDILKIGRESAYRRMRSEIPFTFDEITELSLKLNFSVDEIIGKSMEERIFFDLKMDSLSDPGNSFLMLNEEYYKHIESLSSTKQTEVLISINRFNSLLTVEFDMLFKFFYYKWVHQTDRGSVNCTFSEIDLPTGISAIQEKIKNRIKLVNNVTFVLDRDVFLKLVREIQYYYNRKLISEAEIHLLKEELIAFLGNFERIIQKGKNEFGSTYNFYLSLLDIETNSIYAQYNENKISQYWIYAINSILITNKNVCEMQKKWIESLKKYSVLITQSNEILQATFLNKQREYIEDITKELYYYE